MIKVMESKDYSMFEMMSFNRDVQKTKNLEASMKEHGWIDAYPMHVIQNGNRKFKIKAGHNRFEVATKLKIPVKFVVCDDNASIHELEKAYRPWSLRDYLNSYCRLEKEDYLMVQDYCEESGIALNLAVSMLADNSAGTGNFSEVFKNGTYKIRMNSNHAQIVKDIVLHLKSIGIDFYNAPYLVQAISKIIRVKEFDIGQFKIKVKLFKSLFEKKANLDQYLDLLEEIYNRKNQHRVPLKFFAVEEAKKRKVFGLKR